MEMDIEIYGECLAWGGDSTLLVVEPDAGSETEFQTEVQAEVQTSTSIYYNIAKGFMGRLGQVAKAERGCLLSFRVI
jgi:hypothetical protein